MISSYSQLCKQHNQTIQCRQTMPIPTKIRSQKMTIWPWEQNSIIVPNMIESQTLSIFTKIWLKCYYKWFMSYQSTHTRTHAHTENSWYKQSAMWQQKLVELLLIFKCFVLRKKSHNLTEYNTANISYYLFELSQSNLNVSKTE